ncbi:Lytic transglycosylase, catalytic [Magnetococcus marinus MC-1]|uniref:Lytic transglycosylase, catalytic n=1 Tax=Magnetococcus marinus (strain ATCC BAA-1437 / JCM 17883 / MC-1) TaxID=156889 RepID=A0L423_MAGMM|nr:transglycosylase SLT domain-containing protein [Magnetococcus marinus]ABK42716.1 Lytic transglycosylase, catalytic [Magnetococcus marinus MC-1]
MKMRRGGHLLMRGVVVAGMALVVVMPIRGQAATRQEVKEMVVQEAMRQDVPSTLALAVAKVGSDFQGLAQSKQDAQGVMQLPPNLVERLMVRVTDLSQDQLQRPQVNIRYGVTYLKLLLKQYGENWEKALLHYLSGERPDRVSGGMVLEKEQETVLSMLRWEKRYRDQMSVWQAATGVEVEKLTEQVSVLSRDLRAAREQSRVEDEDWYAPPPSMRGRRGPPGHRHGFRGRGSHPHPPPPPHWRGGAAGDAADFWYGSGLKGGRAGMQWN